MSDFLSSLKKSKLLNSIEIWMRLHGEGNPFIKGGNRFIGTAAFPLAFNRGINPGPVSIGIDRNFCQGVDNAYTYVVNNLEQTFETANAPEPYLSINIALTPDTKEQVFIVGKEFKVMTVTFPRGIPEGLKLANINNRMAANGKDAAGFDIRPNAQAQFTVEDNLANEYTDPFSEKAVLFYSARNNSIKGTSGKGIRQNKWVKLRA